MIMHNVTVVELMHSLLNIFHLPVLPAIRPG